MNNKLASIKITNETAELMRIYCILNKKQMTEFATKAIKQELKNFKKTLNKLKN